MASYKQGYDEERFATSISRNFLCLICFNVLRDPVLCARNQHCFCRACITKYLENSQRCSTCADPLTVETFAEPQRMLKDYLDELNIHCCFVDRGCDETVQLQHLDRHEAACGFQPVVCTNQGCGVTVSSSDLIHHESELCEFRKLKCHSCGEMSKTLEGMEKKMERLETKFAGMETKMATKTNAEIISNIIADVKTEIDGKLVAVNNEVGGLKAALIEGFDQMKEVLVKIEDMKEEITKKVAPEASGDNEKENIFVAGGFETNSVEMFNWCQKLWSPLQPMPEDRCGVTSFVYNNHVTVAGGGIDTMIRMNIDPNPEFSANWSECRVKLSSSLEYHSSVLSNNQLFVSGGYDRNLQAATDSIYGVQFVAPYTVKTLSRMPEPRQFHRMEIYDDALLILGGSTTIDYEDNLKSVMLYDIKKNEYKQLAPLPYAVSGMATVRWGDNIAVIGGADKEGNSLDIVIMYNVKIGQSHMLPRMRCKRQGCAAVVIEKNIVVLGGQDEQERVLKSVEAFNFDRYTWEQLPEMSEKRLFPTALVV